jgi:predicted small lipoprotein YifL
MSPRAYALLARSGFGELGLTIDRLSFRVAMTVAALAALGLSGCGRAGPLELPPGPAAAPSAQLTSPNGSTVPGSADDTAVKTGFDARGNPVATPGEKKTFILDPILR